jgi:hypothetical protein
MQPDEAVLRLLRYRPGAVTVLADDPETLELAVTLDR